MYWGSKAHKGKTSKSQGALEIVCDLLKWKMKFQTVVVFSESEDEKKLDWKIKGADEKIVNQDYAQ